MDAEHDEPRARLLLVDDDANLLDSMRRLLAQRHEVRTAQDGARALRLAETGGPFDVVVADLKMPGMDGIELLSRMSRAWPDTARILLTGYADMQAAMDAANLGYVFRFLTKPCPPEILTLSVDAAVEYSRLLRQRAELLALRRMRSLLEGVVRGLSTLVEQHDLALAGHQERTAELAVAIGFSLGLDAQELDQLRIAALLHDIGKISVPAEIWNRPGRLTPAELALVRTHSDAGAEVLRHVGQALPLARTIREHHERLDGSGYPAGRKGEEIVRTARILAVADVVEAMCSHRPYRPAHSVAEALDELRAGRGTRYDPQVVDACLALFAGGYSLPAQRNDG